MYIFRSIKIHFSGNKKRYHSLKNILGFYPQNINLYKIAFTHSSAAVEGKTGVRNNNERLEYLGDAILSAVIADYLFKKFPFKDEGFLTKMRAKIVSRTSLNRLAFKLGLNNLIESNLTSGTKSGSINGDAFEALIGAIYIDKGFKVASDFIINRIMKHHIDIAEVEQKETDFKSKLIEWAQKEKKEIKFDLIEETGQGNEKAYVIEVLVDHNSRGKAQHFSKKRAEQIASEEAVNSLGIN